MIEIAGSEAEGRDVEVGAQRPVPETLPVLPLRETIPLPDTLIPLAVGQERSVRLIDDVLRGNRMLVMVASRHPEVEAPGPDDLFEVGVVGAIARMIKVPDGTMRVLVQGGQRVHIDRWVRESPYLVAEISELPDVAPAETAELEALTRNVQQTFSSIVEGNPYLPEELQLAIANIDDPSTLSHLIAGSLRLKPEEKQGLLEEADVARRLRRLVDILARELEVISIGSEIQNQVQSEIDKSQREFVLRQQLDAIRRELGEFDESAAEANELRQQLDAIALPEEVRRQVDRELKRLEALPTQAAEHGMIRTWLEWIATLPWDKTTDDNLDLEHARTVLDEDHYDIEQVKDRILEFLAVRKLMAASAAGGRESEARGSILSFIGPPGVGKTSLGRSIARALGRKFERISAGGVRDEAEIRGHRRTYIGAMPGTIIRALRDAGSKNPLFMIDEIDKMGSDWRGDPSSAMLEVLDPEQNATFRDHYLDVPFDLSSVMFITTGNTTDTIPGPLLDRMEVIQLAGYTEEEKLEIAKRYLVPRQIERNGLRKSWISFSERALRAIIRDYTREAGVRNLERQIGTVCRKVAREVAESSDSANGKRPAKASISEARARELLGRPRYYPEVKRRTRGPGVATGLAWTPVGGDVLFIEATSYPGKGRLTITGQLGEVMRESAQAALSYVRGHHAEITPGLGEDWFANNDIHIHVPAGAIPKDGPSAGVTMATALTSLISARPVRDDVAMTGEITLTGQVLPIGGLKEKALAAQRSGIRTVIAPAPNQADVEEIPEHLRRDLEFVFVEEIGEVLAVALEAPSSNGRRRPRAAAKGRV
jgi:ATP-dependent Lon protease